MCFTETWLNELTTASLLTLDNCHLMKVDRQAKESCKKMCRGIARFVNDRCNLWHISVKEQCSVIIVPLDVSIQSNYLLREFLHVLVITVYTPPWLTLLKPISSYTQVKTLHPQSFLLISGDFNHGSLFSTLPTFTKYVTHNTRHKKTLDLLYQTQRMHIALHPSLVWSLISQPSAHPAYQFKPC